MSLLDLHNDFFRPLWVRVLLLCVLFVWSVLEFSTDAPFWGVVFGGVGVVAVWQWFFDDWPEPDDGTAKRGGGDDSQISAVGDSSLPNAEDKQE